MRTVIYYIKSILVFLSARMIKRICLFLFGIVLSVDCYSQSITIENGLSFSKTVKKLDFTTSYTVGLKVNYLEKRYFFLSSGIEYLKKGGWLYFSENSAIVTNRKNNPYLSFNTLFNIKKDIKTCKVFIGCGPRLDRLLSHNKSVSNNYILGIKCNIGVMYKINDFSIGLNLNYLPSLTPFYKEEKVKDKTFSSYLSLEYYL